MNTVQGSISDIRRQPAEGGTNTTFKLHSADGKETPVETRLGFPYNNGDVVQASGDMTTDLVLTAISISRVVQASKPFPWLWVALACALLVIGVLAYRMSSGNSSAGSTLTVHVLDCRKQPVANVWVGVGSTLPKEFTNSQGECAFSGLRKGRYPVLAEGSKTLDVVLDGSSPKSLTFRVNCTATPEK